MSASNKKKFIYNNVNLQCIYRDEGRGEWMREWFEQPMTSDNVMEKQ